MKKNLMGCCYSGNLLVTHWQLEYRLDEITCSRQRRLPWRTVDPTTTSSLHVFGCVVSWCSVVDVSECGGVMVMDGDVCGPQL